MPAAAERQCVEDELTEEIREIHASSRGAYGAPRVHAALRRKGHAVNRKKVERIMRERDIRGVTRRRRRHLTQQDTKAAPAPDLVGRDFTATRPGTKLVGDITYLPTIEGWWYLATVIDLATREVIGYAMAGHHRAELVTDALRMAAGRGGLQPGCIMHTDRGSEGGFNRSLQHLVLGDVDGQASRVDGSVDRAFADEVTRCAGATAGSGTSVLAGDREGTAPGGGGSFGRRIPSGGGKMVPPRWRHATNGSCSAVRPVPVLSRAGRDRDPESAGHRGPGDRATSWP
ncbi:IS3 family transposase [Streptomyces sp. NBC_00057]|uniref:IS3 family transposase n=1 Tax=Streptomyces sp. NBC_00057 TaxID=2975634 RepID=UPI003870E88B